MKIAADIDGAKARFAPVGKLTVHTSPELEEAIGGLNRDVCDIVIDLEGVSYVSSAGMRVLAAADKLAVKRGGMLRVLRPRDEVMELLEMSGLSEVLAIDRSA